MTKRIGKKSAPTVEQSNAYQAAFDYFNNTLWGGALSPCMLQTQRMPKRRLGEFIPKWWGPRGKDGVGDCSSEEDAGRKKHEIALNANVLSQQSLRDIFSTLVHEMAHQWQFDHGAKYVGGYHNKEWGAEMERIGLMPSNTGAPGGKKIGYRMSHYILDGGPYDLAFKAMPPGVSLPWTTGSTEPEVERKKAANKDKVKYSCECSQVWGKSDLGNLWCVRCHRAMTGPGNSDMYPTWEWDTRAKAIVMALAKMAGIPVHHDLSSMPALNIGGAEKPFWGNWLEALVHVADWMPRHGSHFDFGGAEIPVDVQTGVEALPHKAPQIELKEGGHAP